ncbi:MAG: Hsp33 family molecular chaperone [Maricaulaceae bacterium]|nr:Hsp33 family molecular chaperone [Maricaulaceae bacterium]
MSEQSKTDPLGRADDLVAAFGVQDRAVRGRVVRLGETLDLILGAHDYPPAVARLLGEAVMIAALVGDALKFDGKLIVQANGDGPVSFLVAEHVSGEGVRGFAQIDRQAALAAGARAGVGELLGAGAFAMTIDPGAGMERYQGVVELQGRSLADCAEGYFARSEQTPTRLKLAVGEHLAPGEPRRWRGGGAMLQQIAGDGARGDAGEDWTHCLALFDTLADDELVDPDLSMGELLYRLYHEDGARLEPPRSIMRRCSCTRERLARVLASFGEGDQEEMIRDGRVEMTCEYCNRAFAFTSAEIAQAGRGG